MTPGDSPWIEVTPQTLPDSDQTVMVHHPKNEEPVWMGYHDGECWRDIDGMTIRVSHWAPLMEPPKSK